MNIARPLITLLALTLLLAPLAGHTENERPIDADGYLLPETAKQLQHRPIPMPELIKRAESGEVWAQNRLAERYLKGIEAPQHFAKAKDWYTRAANQGYGPAMLQLGEFYSHTKGGFLNLAEAYFWYSLAAANKMPAALTRRDSLLEKLTPAEVAKAQDRAAHWAPKPEGGAKP